MTPDTEELFCLRLAAKASDRATAAEKLRPAFERRLKELGYGPLAIAHAFTLLQGPGSVDEALAELALTERAQRSVAVALEFESVEHEPGLPIGHSLTITDVERDAYGGIRINYAIHPRLPRHAGRPRPMARDDCEHEYASLGSFIGVAKPVDGTVGGFTMPRPHPDASVLRVRISFARDAMSLWERPAHELRITL